MAPKLPLDASRLNADQTLLSLAKSLIKQNPNLEILRPEFAGQYSPLVESLQMQLQQQNARGKLLLPNLEIWGNKSIAIFSDYSGESSGNYYTYSFLVCAMDTLGFFHKEMRKLRSKHALGEKEFAYKDFRMGSMRNALPEYLTLLDQYVPGLLFTVAIDKKLLSVIGPPTKEALKTNIKILTEAGLGSPKPAVAEKLIRVVSIAAFLVGLLAQSGQKIFWMSDHDAICANSEMHSRMLSLFQKAISLYSDDTFPLIGGARPFDERSTDYLDLLSATDVIASSLEHYLTRRDNMGQENATVREGADKILYWLSHDGLSLKKFNMIIRSDKDYAINSGTIEFTPVEYPPDVSYVQIDADRAPA